MATCRPSRPPICRPVSEGNNPGLKVLVGRFRKVHAIGLRNEREFFRKLPSIDLVIHHVAMASELPRPLQILTADEIESFLCIYRALL